MFKKDMLNWRLGEGLFCIALQTAGLPRTEILETLGLKGLPPRATVPQTQMMRCITATVYLCHVLNMCHASTAVAPNSKVATLTVYT